MNPRALVLMAGLAAGCGSHLLIVPLDDGERDELESLRARLHDTLVGIEAPDPGDRKRYVEVFRSAGFSASDAAFVLPGTPIVEVRSTSSEPLGEGGITWLTLGIVPTFGLYSHEADVRAPNGASVESVEVSTAWIRGWAGLLMSLLPDWESDLTFVHYGLLPYDRFVLDVMRAVARHLPRE